MGKNRRRSSGAAQERAARRQREKQAAQDAERIRSGLSSDPDWRLATASDASWESERQARRTLMRLTKAALKALYPQHRWSVRHGRGTGRHWVYVTLVVPPLAGPGASAGLRQETETARGHASHACAVLERLGLRYATYLPDSVPGFDRPTPCLSVDVRGAVSY